jgi:hypothetical protein
VDWLCEISTVCWLTVLEGMKGLRDVGMSVSIRRPSVRNTIGLLLLLYGLTHDLTEECSCLCTVKQTGRYLT